MHRKLNWLRWTVAVILFVVGLALIFNQQIKSALVDSYRPTVTRQAVVKNQKKNRQGSPAAHDAAAGTLFFL